VVKKAEEVLRKAGPCDPLEVKVTLTTAVYSTLVEIHSSGMYCPTVEATASELLRNALLNDGLNHPAGCRCVECFLPDESIPAEEGGTS
jgi:hypothetical protein